MMTIESLKQLLQSLTYHKAIREVYRWTARGDISPSVCEELLLFVDSDSFWENFYEEGVHY